MGLERSMHDLEPAKEVMRIFLQELNVTEKIQTTIPSSFFTTDSESNSPSNTRDLSLARERAYAWIFATTHYQPLALSASNRRPLPHFYSQHAKPLFDKWLAKILDVQNIKTYRIPDPRSDETIYAFLERLRSILIEKRERRQIW